MDSTDLLISLQLKTLAFSRPVRFAFNKDSIFSNDSPVQQNFNCFMRTNHQHLDSELDRIGDMTSDLLMVLISPCRI